MMASKKFYVKLRDMIRLWYLIWYFTRPARPISNTVPSWKDEISRFELWSYLAFKKHFCEDWKDTVLRYYYYLGGRRPTTTTERGMKRAKDQKQRIEDLIDKALKQEYLLVARTANLHPTSSEIFLTIDYRGRDFLRNPLMFFNVVFKEYGYFTSFLFVTGGTLFVVFFNKIISFFS